MTVKARFGADGKVGIADEVVEIPPELTGDRNLFEGSASIKKSTGSAEFPREYLYFSSIQHALDKCEIGDDITISFDVQATKGAFLLVYNSNRDGERVFSPQKQFTNFGTAKQRLSFVTKLMPNTGTIGSPGNTFIEFYSNYDSGDFFTISNLKIEKGIKTVTPTWQPAPEDLGYAIPNWIHNFDNPVQFHGEGVAARRVVEIPAELMGGRNLIKDSGVLKRGAKYDLGHYLFGEHTLVEGETYTITAKFQHGSDRARLSLYSSGGYNSPVSMTNAERNSEGICSKTFVMSYAAGKKPSDSDIYKAVTLYQMPSSGTTSSTIEWVKIEKGVKTTPWQAAPEDLGYSLPGWIHNFNGPQFNKEGIAIKEIEEGRVF
ncbi:hypothetical protein FZD47_25250 [Bacillus infantis]|uniref:Uncharacterized protein n=1 Tax=Bacillus infantis TaxID=324767 RepID=A0A5D4RWP4_9BACI|nr:hypothetical protein [Bacillus infantis]TYS55737.1 hypothetical protein FZD47_25250 [Bacillus infantis]